MARYSLAASLIALLVSNAQGHDDGTDAWSYLPVTVPTPLSDMSIVSLTLGGGNNSTEGEDGDEVKTRIIITGGCDSPMGNEYMEFGEDKFFDCVSLSAKAYAFDPIRNNKFQAWTGTFETLADMPRKRARHASAVVNGNVCLYGGRNETGSLIAEVDCYNPTSNEWSTPTSIPAERQSSDFTAFSTKDHLVYLIGGYTQDYEALDLVTVVDMSDPDNISYSDGPNLRAKRGDIDVAVVNGDVYVSGGFTHENDYATPLNSVEKFNAETQTWSNVDSLNEERGDKQLVALNGKVYAIGGESKVDVTGFEEDELPDLGARSELLDTVEVLDPTEDVHGGMAQWKSLAGMPGQLFRFAASEWEVDEGFIFVFGGQVAYDSDCKCFRTTDKVMVLSWCFLFSLGDGFSGAMLVLYLCQSCFGPVFV
mmetsp:Transcript_5871/g.9253  ORF Transcript_5871/g.9253 Transcript_5871/m.9253 type:complete len:423 (+) Transcript_5871:36-1304(+)